MPHVYTGRRILNDALQCAVRCDQADSVEILLDAGVDIDINSEDDHGRMRTPLLAAAEKNSINSALALLTRGADVDVSDEYLNTALHLACTSQNEGFRHDDRSSAQSGGECQKQKRNYHSATAADILQARTKDVKCSEAVNSNAHGCSLRVLRRTGRGAAGACSS